MKGNRWVKAQIPLRVVCSAQEGCPPLVASGKGYCYFASRGCFVEAVVRVGEENATVIVHRVCSDVLSHQG